MSTVITDQTTTVAVDLDAVAHNTRVLARHTRSALMAVVKADGFGHGAVDVARTALASGATWLGVTGLGEALALRAAGLRAPILSWLNPLGAGFASGVRNDVDLAVPSVDHLAVMPTGARVHLHLDTGLARDGAAPKEWADLCRAAADAERDGRIVVAGVMSHLAGPDTQEALRRFRHGVSVALTAGLRPRVRHLAATAATLTAPDTHFDLVRTGAGLVGINPAGGPGRDSGSGGRRDEAGGNGLRGAMTFTAPVVEVRRVTAGTPVGYGHVWRAPRDTTLALLPAGYADGLPRIAGPRAEVLLGGRRRRIAGRISMDQIVVEAGPDCRPGDTAIIFGPGDDGEPTVADWARWAGTLPHEIVTGLGARPRRVVTGGF
ncbi:alanine racemase [Actinoplanes lutulentus]|uniref:Alanine racemase n=1 Tax=Actinoplanes lutulentus TaxID=1287878 RepID=A0A327Z7G5_9ACTN|nr:alanine racemase [Actinoplanes lutulentus]MBB2948283.1 alanine racemase [Actinoplanes lutulentus]RAK31220.1 alanine racemase [Actinoplanes lutulentus]